MAHRSESNQGIRYVLCVTFLVGMLVASARGQSNEAPRFPSAKDLIGTWRASFNGQTYWVVRVASVEPQLLGEFSHASTVEFDTTGKVKEVSGVEELKNFEVMGAPRFKDGRLIFRWTDRSDAGELEMSLVSSTRATLRFVNQTNKEDDDNLRHLRPFQLRKEN